MVKMVALERPSPDRGHGISEAHEAV